MSQKNYRSFEDLECWKACTEVRRSIAALVENYPNDERFSLVDNMKKSARSTTHYIAEGFGRYDYQDSIRLCRYSRGSLNKLIDQLIISQDEGFITEKDYENGRSMISHALALLSGYINFLSRQKEQVAEK